VDQTPTSIQSGPPPNTAVTTAQPPPLLTWPTTAQIALGLILLSGIFFLVGRWSLSWARPQPVHGLMDRDSPSLDLNRATQAELRLLPGVGDSLAQRIVEYRDQHGPFQRFDDLKQVNGIGPKALARLRPWLFVHQEEISASEEADRTPRPSKAASKPQDAAVHKVKTKALPTHLIDVNHASQDELRTIPGIGPVLSQRIMDQRAKSPFKSINDLRRVQGIGAKTLEKMRPYVTIDEFKK
jgi:competence protein ComEA